MTNFAVIIYDGLMYRPAGYRVPGRSELYVSKDGKVKKNNGLSSPAFDSPRLVVRQVTPTDVVPGQEIPK